MNGVNGFLPCFSRHQDNHFSIAEFYKNPTFVGKVEEFVKAIITSQGTQALKDKIHPKGGIQTIDPLRNSDDKALCLRLGWQESKIYRVDYGDNTFRILFGLDHAERRCHILALDTNHQTRPQKKGRRRG